MVITQERIKELLEYDPETGVLRWKYGRTGAGAGKMAGSRHPSGHMRTMVDGVQYATHRLAWFYVYGVWPKQDIDHINGIPDDNRLANLRQATRSQNSANGKVRRRGLKGVSYIPKYNKWVSRIRKDGKLIFLGHFATEQDAHNAYCAGAKQLFGEFARAI